MARPSSTAMARPSTPLSRASSGGTVTSGPQTQDLTGYTEQDHNSISNGAVTYSGGVNTVPVSGDAGNDVDGNAVGARVFYKTAVDQDGTNVTWSDDYIVQCSMVVRVVNGAALNNTGVEITGGFSTDSPSSTTPAFAVGRLRYTTATTDAANVAIGGDAGGAGGIANQGASVADTMVITAIVGKDTGDTYPRVLSIEVSTYNRTPGTPLMVRTAYYTDDDPASEEAAATGTLSSWFAVGAVNNSTSASPQVEVSTSYTLLLAA